MEFRIKTVTRCHDGQYITSYQPQYKRTFFGIGWWSHYVKTTAYYGEIDTEIARFDTKEEAEQCILAILKRDEERKIELVDYIPFNPRGAE